MSIYLLEKDGTIILLTGTRRFMVICLVKPNLFLIQKQQSGFFQISNDERMLGIGQSTTYHMKPGRITEWAIEAWDYPNGSWYTDSYYLEQCETHNDPWTDGKKKGTKNLEKLDVKVDSTIKITHE